MILTVASRITKPIDLRCLGELAHDEQGEPGEPRQLALPSVQGVCARLPFHGLLL